MKVDEARAELRAWIKARAHDSSDARRAGELVRVLLDDAFKAKVAELVSKLPPRQPKTQL